MNNDSGTIHGNRDDTKLSDDDDDNDNNGGDDNDDDPHKRMFCNAAARQAECHARQASLARHDNEEAIVEDITNDDNGDEGECVIRLSYATLIVARSECAIRCSYGALNVAQAEFVIRCSYGTPNGPQCDCVARCSHGTPKVVQCECRHTLNSDIRMLIVMMALAMTTVMTTVVMIMMMAGHTDSVWHTFSCHIYV